MSDDLTAHASISVRAPRERVWRALTTAADLRRYMFGAEVESAWTEGSPIVWRGEWEGTPFEDHGTVLLVAPGSMLQYTHASGAAERSGKPRVVHTVTIRLSGGDDGTRIDLAQDNNGSEWERQHAEDNWRRMLAGLKQLVEEPRGV